MNQLDLFLDGRSVRLSNALRLALLDEDVDAAVCAHRDLREFDPTHHWLAPAKALIAGLRTSIPGNHEEGLAAMACLEEEWIPAALTVLGEGSREWLHRKWRDVGSALEGRPFDLEFPERHASYAYTRCEDWFSVERCILAVPDFSEQPILLERMAEAVWRQRRWKDAAGLWFELCWSAPDRLQGLMNDGAVPDPVLRDGWERWQDLDLESLTSPSWFPACMLIHEPKIAELMPVPAMSDAPKAAFAVLLELTIGNGDEMDLRIKLQRLHPELLASFLSRR